MRLQLIHNKQGDRGAFQNIMKFGLGHKRHKGETYVPFVANEK
jgi:hypothetical protein